jgi:CRP/FNR family cyclic AMP-dependent transcriptional regulator
MEDLLELCQEMDIEVFEPGDLMIAEGGKTGCLFILISGTVEVMRGDALVTRTDEPGAIFGELSLLLGADHPASLRAVTDVRCYVSRADREFLVANPHLAVAVAELLALRLTDMMRYLADLKGLQENRQDPWKILDVLLRQRAPRPPKH